MADRDYLVTARKYRPSLFREVVAQEHVTSTLKNAIRMDRVAHAYLFSGPRGVGKTTAARILAKAINCETPRDEREDGAEPCRECESCRTFEEGGSLNVFELDAASNRKVGDVEPLLEKVTIPPQGGRKKVYIIDEVHMFSKHAFNALLKTLEEPPDHALFIFATTEPNKVIPTVRSRCQRFDFRRIPVPKTVAHLREICETEGIEADEESLMLLARKGNGALRDALSAFDQAISLCGDTLRYDDLADALGVVDQDLYFDLTDHVAERDTAAVLRLVRHVVRSGYDLQEFLVGLAEHLRHLLVARSLGSDALEEVAESTRRQYAEAAEAFGEADLLRLLTIAGDAEDEVKNSPQPRLKLETTLLKMAQLRRAADLDQVLQKIDRLERMADEGALPDTVPVQGGDEGGASPSADAQTTGPAAGTDAADEGAAGGTAASTPTSADEPTPSYDTAAPDASAGPASGEPQPSPDADDATGEPAGSPSMATEDDAPVTDPEEPTADATDSAAPPTSDDPGAEGETDRGGTDEDDTDGDDPGVAYNDLFGTPALEEDPAPSGDGGPPDDANGNGPNADGRSGPAPDGNAGGPQAQAAVAEPPATVEDDTSVQDDASAGIVQDWPQLVQAVRSNHIRLGIFLDESEPTRLSDGVLTVSVPRALHRDTLRDHRHVLLDHLDTAVGAEVEDLQIVVDEPTPDTEDARETEPASPREQLQDLRDTYPALDVLFREFEAEPVW